MNRHPLDVFSLGAGIVFALLALGFLLGQVVDLTLNGALVFPTILIVLGALGLYAGLRAQRSSDTAGRPESDLREQ